MRAKRRRTTGDELTQRQREILAALRDGIARTGFVPSVREIGAAVGLRSTASVHGHLHELERRGYIRRSLQKARAIELLEGGGREAEAVRAAPVVGRVPAGPPLLAQEDRTDDLLLPAADVGERTFALRVRGDSMIGAGILDGDYVVVEAREDAEDGTIVVALLGEEATVKRLSRRRDGPWLVAENPVYAPLPAREARILGRVIGIYRSV